MKIYFLQQQQQKACCWTPRGCLVSVKQQFSVFKQYFTYFHILFYPHVFPQKFLNNNFQFLNTCTKRAPSLLILHEIFRIAQLMYSLISYIILLSSDCVVLDPLIDKIFSIASWRKSIYSFIFYLSKKYIFFYLLYSNFLFGVGEDKICWRVSCMSKFDVRL